MEGEIREFEGKLLNSIDDFIENSIKGPQVINIENYKLIVSEEGGIKKEYKYDDLINNFDSIKKVITLYCVDGWSVDILWEGILMKDILIDSKVNLNYPSIIFYGIDGYTTSLAKDFVFDNDLFLSYKMNGVILPNERGFPFQLIGEYKWAYKWIKWINKIELSNNINFKGYWESRGYSNSANLNEPFFGR
ncbi:MAG TPA: molybdopterin-dependent oxidoreductase [Caldisericia bacterium]|nr:molybdopterin-dependent oxidoreductase [Caldisericia bacterium]